MMYILKSVISDLYYHAFNYDIWLDVNLSNSSCALPASYFFVENTDFRCTITNSIFIRTMNLIGFFSDYSVLSGNQSTRSNIRRLWMLTMKMLSHLHDFIYSCKMRFV